MENEAGSNSVSRTALNVGYRCAAPPYQAGIFTAGMYATGVHLCTGVQDCGTVLHGAQQMEPLGERIVCKFSVVR